MGTGLCGFTRGSHRGQWVCMGMRVSTVNNYIPSKINILRVSERVHSLAPPPILKVKILEVKEIYERVSERSAHSLVTPLISPTPPRCW
jgi:hypothetical protein